MYVYLTYRHFRVTVLQWKYNSLFNVCIIIIIIIIIIISSSSSSSSSCCCCCCCCCFDLRVPVNYIKIFSVALKICCGEFVNGSNANYTYQFVKLILFQLI